jgi:cell division protein FtsB
MLTPAKPKYIVISAFFILASINFTKTALDILKSSKRLDDLNSDINTLEAKQANLQKNIEYKKTDAYIEERARNDLNMVKPGEKLLVFVDNNQLTKLVEPVLGDVLAKSDTRKQKASVKESNFRQWYRLFFDK